MEQQLYETLLATDRLPSPSGVALGIVKLLQTDNYRIDELAHFIQSDPVIAGCVLKFANSPTFGHEQAVVSLRKAVIALGAVRVRNLVLGFSLLQSRQNTNCGGFDLQKFWSKSLAMAIANQELAPRAKIAPEDNFTIGLLCSIGELALAVLHPDDYSELVAAPATNLLAVEHARFGVDHRELSAKLMEEWGLPDFLIRAAYHHERPDDSGHATGSRNQMLALTLHFARSLAELCTARDSERWSLLPHLVTVAARLGMASDELPHLADRVVASWQEWGRALQIRTQDLPPFADLLAAAPPTMQHNGGSHRVAPCPATALTLLLVGGVADESQGMRKMFELPGREIRTARNYKEALALASRDVPQILVAELDRDSITLCRSIHENPATKDIYIILVAAAGEEEHLHEAANFGADDFLIKPLNVKTLNLRLRSAQRVLDLTSEIWRERRGVMHTADLWAIEQRRLMLSSMTDSLTKLPNRRHGEDFLSSEWASAVTSGNPLACLMLDIDFFKQINDQYGHEAGDSVLTQTANVIKLCLRRQDLAFRYGGEEFAIICSGANRDTAAQVGERVRLAVQTEAFRHLDHVIRVTISVGVGVMEEVQADHMDLLKDADRALFRAKRHGRNRVEI